MRSDHFELPKPISQSDRLVVALEGEGHAHISEQSARLSPSSWRFLSTR